MMLRRNDRNLENIPVGQRAGERNRWREQRK